jgi:two-component system, LytTR family, sensor kinase
MFFFDSKKGLPSFWKIQITGWLVYMVAIYITFLTVVPPANYLSLFYVKSFRALTGFCLTCILRQIYLRFAGNFSIQSIILLVLVCALIFGCAWAGIEVGYYLLTSPNYNFAANAVRLPSYALDYAMTLTGWSALYFGIKYWQQWQTERDNALKAVALANQAQLEMLRYQLNPHFLFNALNSIRASIDEDAKRAKQMITQLSEFLRYSLLNESVKKITLRDEIEAVRNYLAIEKIRFEDKLEIEFEIERQAEDFSVPCFLLNPLVENAIKHGLQTSSKPLRIKISALLKNRSLILEVANTGNLENGFSQNGTKIGLKNVRERLEKLFGERGKFRLIEENGFVKARIEIANQEN